MKETVDKKAKKSILDKINSVTGKISKPVKDRVEGYSKLDNKVKSDMKKAALVGAGFIVGVLFS